MESSIYAFNNIEVRTARTEQGEPIFCLADVCKCLDISDPSNTVRQIKEEFEGSVLNTAPFETTGGVQNLTMITEPQLYFVMMRSRSEHARTFRQWVCNEVLPSIRKTGSYSANSSITQTGDDFVIEWCRKYLPDLKWERH